MSLRTLTRSLLWLPLLLAACGPDHQDLLSGGAAGNGPAACKQTSDCSGPQPVCDTSAGVCVQCLFETQCPAEHTCSPQHACVALTRCSSSLDCVANPSSPICDPSLHHCVECVTAADCNTAADCVERRCVLYTPCSTSLDCPQGSVCAQATQRCVQCEVAADCGPNKACIGNACKDAVACQSDNQCTPLGKLCDKQAGLCVECLQHSQCPETSYCAAGSCALDVCQANASKCDGNAIATCSGDGDKWTAPVACPAQTSCKSGGGAATCASWVCQPGTVACEGDKLVTCAADGLSAASTVNCAATGMSCVAGACSSLACAPGAKFCQGAELRQCNAEGTGSTLLQTCASNQYCDGAAADCKALLCTPGQPVCNGNLATTCNAAGTGYNPGGTDCTSQGKSCVAGACAGCPGSGVAPDAVRLVEVFIGTDDYVVLENRGACPAQIDSLRVRFEAVDTSSNMELDLPPRVLGPAERVYVVDKFGAKAGDIASEENIFLTPDTGGNVLLCMGACSSGNVLDFFSHASGAQPPSPSFGITFTPGPVGGITFSTEDSNAYLRVQFTGSFPGFKSADWQMGAASRPWVNSPQCPPAKPSGSSCSPYNLMCKYDASTCICLGAFGWICT